jgi:MYXO-CTERM domain-containing protein
MSISADAAFLGLPLVEPPDIAAGFIDISYDAVTDSFEAVGFALEYDDDGSVPAETITNGAFNLSATVNSSGVATGGSVTVGGSVLGFGPTLLTGDLVAIGFDDAGGQVLEFLFDITGGDLQAEYGGGGGQFGIIMDTRAGGYSGDWSKSFDNLVGGLAGTGAGVADIKPVPGPAGLALLALGGLGCRRRRRHT